MSWLLNRLREPSTWRGIVWLLTVAGWSLRPDQAEAIVTFGITLIGLIGVFLPDAQPQPALPPIELQSHVENDPALFDCRAANPRADPDAGRLRVELPAHARPEALDERGAHQNFPGWGG